MPHMQQPTHQQINQRLQATIGQNQANQAQNYHPSQPPAAMNGQAANNTYAANQMPPKALTPQPPGAMPPQVQYQPGQMPPQRVLPPPPQQLQQQQQQRPGYGPGPAQPPNNNNFMAQPVKSTTPTLTSQLGPGQQAPQVPQQRRQMPGQQQQQAAVPPGVQAPYSQAPQANRMIQPQPGQAAYQAPAMGMSQIETVLIQHCLNNII